MSEEEVIETLIDLLNKYNRDREQDWNEKELRLLLYSLMVIEGQLLNQLDQLNQI